ncbi:MAG: aminopeptidase [Reichenbachiella sp.]|uniref:aminopeptidase n=1 Tax=Reichenbachiella sp. TaxID=2184521 RepID=UPI0032678886
MKKVITGLGVCVLLLIAIAQLEVVAYLYMQASGQLEVLWNARPIDEILKDQSVDSVLKDKIRLVDRVMLFAEADLGLKTDGLYKTLYDQKGEDILWNLSVCEPYQLKSVEWYFPIVGAISYKGYFNLDLAKEEGEKWKEKGYDIRIRPVNAWSTLGWFSDPILSNSLERSEGGISELFIHEITHSNIFISDSLSFNENLASFIGEKGARLFLAKEYGENSEQYKSYIREEEDTQMFINYCLYGLNELNNLYRSLDNSMPESDKRIAKEIFMTNWVSKLDSMPFNDTTRFENRFINQLPNNAFFMSFERYDSKKKAFNKILENDFDHDLKRFINFYKEQD